MALAVSILVGFSLILAYSYAGFLFDVEKCREELRSGRKILQQMIPELVSRENDRQTRLRAEHFKTYQKALERDNFQSVLEEYHCVNKTDPTCPNVTIATLEPPGPTGKTTIPPKKTTISPEKTTILPEKNTGATEENTGSTKENTENSTPESLGSTKKAFDEYEEQEEEKKEAYKKLKEEDLYIPAFMSDDSESDIIASFIKFIYSSLKKEEEVCNGPSFTGFNSLTEEQVYGQLAIFLTNYGKPLCSICDRLVGQMDLWFRKAHTFMADDEAYIFNLYLSKIPQKETICSILLPTCHEEYVSDAENGTTTNSNSTCLECNLCMTGATILMQKFILVPSEVDKLNGQLNETFHDICAELCHNTSSLAGGPGYFPYCGCRDFIQKQWNFFFNAAKRIFMPNYLCANTLGWCRTNETPNILHCLKDLCDGLSGEMQILKIICNMIPDEPEEADKYLNIKRQKEEL